MKKIMILLTGLVASIIVGEAFGQGQNGRNTRLNRPSRGLLGNRAVPAAQSATVTAPAGGEAAAKSSDGRVTSIEFNAAPLDLVFTTYGNLISKTILKDPGLPTGTTITLKPKEGQELTDEEKIFAIETVLEMNGVHIEPYGETDKFVRAIPRAKIRTEGVPLILDPEKLDDIKESTRMVSFMIKLENISYEEAQKVFEGLKSKDAQLQVFERTNSILVTDTGMNIRRMLEIKKELDVATPITDQVFDIQIKYASATEIKTVLEAIVQDSKQEQEKANGGKQLPVNNQRPQPPGLLRRGNQQQQPAASTGNETLVNSMSDADRGTIRGKVLIIADERSNKLIIVTSKANMDFFQRVIDQLDVETTPDTVVKVYRLKYADADKVSDMINDLIGNAPSSKSTSKGNQNQSAKKGTSGNLSGAGQRKSANQRTGEAKAGELSKENTTVLADERINGLVVMTSKELVPVMESIIEAMDIKLSQVLIETVIIEVTLGDDLKTGIDWVRNGREEKTTQAVDSHGAKLYWNKTTDDDGNEFWEKTTEETSWPVTITKIAKNGLWTGTAGYASAMGGGASGGTAAADVVTGVATNLFGSAFNYVFKSDDLNLSAIIQASKTDSRTKYIASPVVMTVDNKEATIEATTARKFLSNYQTSSSYYGSTPAPQYESKDIGIKIKVTPKINPNGTVMLEVEEEYSQVGAKQSILDPNSNPVSIDTAMTRKMSADALLENNQTVVLCGLTETTTSEAETGIPILKDIPWIGKWLFSSVEQSESRAELLIFMTPYVLADGPEAEAEALRRKQALSDQNSWDDHGWSKSKLADPVRAKELLRRQKEQWKKLDDDHDSQRQLDHAKQARVLDLQERQLNDKKTDREFSEALAERQQKIDRERAEMALEPEQEESLPVEEEPAK